MLETHRGQQGSLSTAESCFLLGSAWTFSFSCGHPLLLWPGRGRARLLLGWAQGLKLWGLLLRSPCASSFSSSSAAARNLAQLGLLWFRPGARETTLTSAALRHRAVGLTFSSPEPAASVAGVGASGWGTWAASGRTAACAEGFAARSALWACVNLSFSALDSLLHSAAAIWKAPAADSGHWPGSHQVGSRCFAKP